MITKMVIIILIATIAIAVVTYPTGTGCELAEDTILLQQAVNDGWSIIIVKDVLATSPKVILITE